MLGAAAGAGLFMVYSPLPDPAVASRHDLFRWLVLRDLGKESDDIRRKILGRVDTEFQNVDDMSATIENLDQPHRQMLWHNVTVLLEPWLLGKAEQYPQLPTSARNEFVDHFLDCAQQWSKVGAACTKSQGAAGQGTEAASSKQVIDQMQQCVNRANPDQRRKIATFVTAVEGRWLWRQLPSINLFGKPGQAR